MELTIREAAVLLGRKPRTLRAQLARGELPGRKLDGVWRLESRQLPLTEAQRDALQRKADRVRQAVDDVLPSRMAASPQQRSRSIADLDAFRRGQEILSEMRQANEDLDTGRRERAAAILEEALLAFAEGVVLFDKGHKLEAVNRSRSKLARCAAMLLIEGGIPPAEPIFGWVSAIESEIVPAVAGFARWADGRRSRR